MRFDPLAWIDGLVGVPRPEKPTGAGSFNAERIVVEGQ